MRIAVIGGDDDLVAPHGDRLANGPAVRCPANRCATAVKAAELVAGRYSDAAGETCFTNQRIGLARARVPFDSFSAGPLLGRLCAPLLHPGVLVYTVDSQVVSGNLPFKIAGGTGNGVFVDFPVLTEDQSVTVRGYTIEVTEDRGGVHRVQITKN